MKYIEMQDESRVKHLLDDEGRSSHADVVHITFNVLVPRSDATKPIEQTIRELGARLEDDPRVLFWRTRHLADSVRPT